MVGMQIWLIYLGAGEVEMEGSATADAQWETLFLKAKRTYQDESTCHTRSFTGSVYLPDLSDVLQLDYDVCATLGKTKAQHDCERSRNPAVTRLYPYLE